MTDDFVERASRLIFNFALPALLFTTISKSSLDLTSELDMLLVGIVSTVLVCALMMLVCPFLVQQRSDRGVVIQGAFRSNMGIIGLAYCANAYGDAGIALGSIYLGALTILYNIISVGILNFYLDSKTSFLIVLKGIATNPIILSIIAALTVSEFNIKIPDVFLNSAGYFSQLTLPLALLCTGAALRFTHFKDNAKAASVSVLVKCLVYPGIIIFAAIYFKIEGLTLGVIYLMSIAPTAAASYVMVRKIGGNHQLAAQIIAISTILSVPVTIIGYTFLSHYL